MTRQEVLRRLKERESELRKLGPGKLYLFGSVARDETSRKLSTELKARHPDIPWEGIYRLRNIVVHAYPTIKPAIIWDIVTTQLDALEAVCRTELERLGG